MRSLYQKKEDTREGSDEHRPPASSCSGSSRRFPGWEPWAAQVLAPFLLPVRTLRLLLWAQVANRPGPTPQGRLFALGFPGMAQSPSKTPAGAWRTALDLHTHTGLKVGASERPVGKETSMSLIWHALEMHFSHFFP